MANIEEDFKEMDRNHDGNVDLKELRKEVGKTKKAAMKSAVKFLHEVGESQTCTQLKHWTLCESGEGIRPCI